MKQLTASSILLLMVLLITAPQDARAQIGLELAPHIGYGLSVPNQVGDRGSMSVGVQAHLTLKVFRWGSLILNPDFDYYLIDIEGVDGYQLDGNLLLSLGRPHAIINPYVGLGLAFTNATGSESFSEITKGSDLGLNIVGGLLLGAGSPRVFFQGRYTLADHHLFFTETFNNDPSTSLGIQGGIMFKL